MNRVNKIWSQISSYSKTSFIILKTGKDANDYVDIHTPNTIHSLLDASELIISDLPAGSAAVEFVVCGSTC